MYVLPLLMDGEDKGDKRQILAILSVGKLVADKSLRISTIGSCVDNATFI